jgi:endonuclease IV
LRSLLLGSHMSVAGGVHTAFARGASIGCTTMQVFVKNNNQWFGKPQTEDDVQNYKTAEAKTTIAPVVAHAAYLINLCATNADTLKKSRSAFVDELQRCDAFGITALIFHPGAHMGAGEDDSKKPLGSRVDRHDHIGKGLIGLTGFRMLMNDERLVRIPKILETEKSEDMHEDVENMITLNALIK